LLPLASVTHISTSKVLLASPSRSSHVNIRPISVPAESKWNSRSPGQLSNEPMFKSSAHTSTDPLERIGTVIKPVRQYGVGFLQSSTVNRYVHCWMLPHMSSTIHIIRWVPIG